MRLSWLLALPLLAAAGPAQPQAAALFAERSALLAVDARCALLSPGARAALEAGRAQARNTLRRADWALERLDALQSNAETAGRGRACTDAQVSAAVQDARAGFAAWSRQHSAVFTGLTAGWTARRTPDPQGWRLWQDVAGAVGARFGVRQTASGEALTLVAPWTGRAPATARVSFRDVARSPRPLLSVPGQARAVSVLERGVSPPGQARAFLASAIRPEGARIAVSFPPAAFDAAQALDPRETLEITLSDARGAPIGRALVEVGDLAAARAFLAAQPET